MHPLGRVPVRSILFLALTIMLFWSACSDDDGPSTPADTTPPAAVTNLAVQTTTTNSVTLRWTAPGDDGATGRAATYDLRYAPGEASVFVWAQATEATGEPAPQEAGSTEAFTVNNLTSGSVYTFALKTADDTPNWSAVSNLVSGTPGGGATGCQVAPTVLDFGPVNIGTASERTFTITNSGTLPLSGTVSESCDDFSIVSGGGAYTLNAAEVRTVTVRYAPTAAGNHTCSVETGTPICADVACSGVGVQAPTAEMILIPAGPFTMGSDPEEGTGTERPEHSPNISAFYIDKYEVTNAQYAEALNWAVARNLVTVENPDPDGTVLLATGNLEPILFMDYGLDENNQCHVTWNGSSFGVEGGWEDHPVVWVNWWGAAAYCNWRSVMAGRTACYDTSTWECDFNANGYRLPTEAEWEKAARGSTDERTYPWGDGAATCELLNYAPDGPQCVGYTARVDDPEYSDGVSPYGVWQMAGNVWEWCNDWFDDSYYANSPSNDPRGPADTGYRVNRGGSWWDGEYWQRCAVREGSGPLDTFDRLGFRTALSTQETTGCQVQPTSLTFPETQVGSTVDRTFTITNNGTGTLAGSVSETCDMFSLVSGGGAYSLAAGQSVTVTVRYAPTAAGSHTCTVETGASACSDVSCTGTATGGGTAGCTVNPGTLAFGSVVVGQEAELSFTIANTGSTNLSGTISESCAHFSIESGGGAYTLTPGQQRTVEVKYAPTAAGSHTCTIDTGDGACADVSCTGTATGGGTAGCTVNPTTLTFPQTEVGRYGELAFVITNSGTTTLAGTVTESCDQFSIQTGGGAYSLAPGAQRTVVVRYAPTAAGTHTCTIDTGDAACSDVTCSGTAAQGGAAGCNVNPVVLNFPNTGIGSHFDYEIQIQNDGESTLTGTISITGCAEFSVVAGSSYSVSPGGTHNATIRYAPTTNGTHTCVVETGNGACVDVACAGTSVAVNPSCFVWPTVILNFTPRTVGTYEDKTFNIQNIGAGTLTGTVNESCEHYSLISGGGAYSIAMGQSHAVTVRYAPTAAGTHVCEIDTGTSCTNVGCTGLATSEGGSAICSVDPILLVFPETLVGASAELGFTIRNSGDGGTVSGTVTESCDHFSIVSGGGSYSLGAGQERAVVVRYTPTAAGSHECIINTGGSCSPVGCSGTASQEEEPPMCDIQPSSLQFEATPVGESRDLEFSISNAGGGTLTGSVNESCSHYSIVSGGGAFSLGAGANKTVTVRFAPTTAGEHQCSVDLGGVCSDLPCTGTGTEETGVCRVEPASLDFGIVTVGGSLDLDFTITNDGGGSLTGSVSEGCPNFSVQSGAGAFSLPAGESRTVTVRFAPPAEEGYLCFLDLGTACGQYSCSGSGGSAPEENMVLIPAGSFTMGSDEGEGTGTERPEHAPYVSAYYIDRYEVTNAQYAEALNWAEARNLVTVESPDPDGIVLLATGNLEPILFMDYGLDENNQCHVTWNGSSFGVEGGWEDHPVVWVNWWGAAAYCNWRSAMAGRTACYDTNTWECDFNANGYRLPTEAEWEKAARGGTDERTYPWGDDAATCELLNYAPDGPHCVGYTARVDDPEYSDGVSPYGVWQMAGNVWEWCNDWFDDHYYENSPANDPTGPADTGYRVNRGGSWWDGEYWQRCAVREGSGPLDTFDRLGFRVVRR